MLLDDLFVVVWIHEPEDLPHQMPMLRLLRIQVQHCFEEFARLLHGKPAKALVVEVVEELGDVLHALGDLPLAVLLHALLVVLEDDGHEHAQQEERADRDVHLEEQLERWPHSSDLKHFIREVLSRKRGVKLEVR